MTINKIKQALFGAMLAATVFSAHAAPLLADLGDTLGPLDGGSVTKTLVSPGAGTADISFDLLGYLSVDGVNCCTDTFTFGINGTALFVGNFDMGGGGFNFVSFSDPSVTIVSTQSFGFFAGGLTQFSVNHLLEAGTNTYFFDFGQMQGLGDEGWGLRNVIVSGDVREVPEPASSALFGLALAGLMLRRRRSV